MSTTPRRVPGNGVPVSLSFPLEVTTFSTRIQENLDFLESKVCGRLGIPGFSLSKRNKGFAMNVPQVYVSKPAQKGRKLYHYLSIPATHLEQEAKF